MTEEEIFDSVPKESGIEIGDLLNKIIQKKIAEENLPPKKNNRRGRKNIGGY